MSNMFNNCTSLTNLDIPNFVIENNTRIKYMFSNCSFGLQNKIKTQLKNINNNAFIKGKKKYDDDLALFNDLSFDLDFEPLIYQDYNEFYDI